MLKKVLSHRTFLVGTVFFLLLIVMSAAWAAGEPMTMDELYFSIWPEYDSPDVLVINSGTFVNNTGKDFQEEIRYYMPKGAKVNMVCETEKGMVCQKYVVETSKPDYDQVVWKPSRVIKPGEQFPVMFEYNYNTFSAPGERKFAVPFQFVSPVNKLVVEVKEPKNATGLQLNPASTSNQQDDEGFKNYYYQYEKVKPEEKMLFEVSYNRNETKPSKNPAAAGAAESQPSSGGSPINSTVVGFLVVFLVLLAIFMFYALKMGNPGGGGSRGRAGAGKQQSRDRGGVATPSKTKNQSARGNTSQATVEEKKKIRKLLLDGKISEETYRQLKAELDED